MWIGKEGKDAYDGKDELATLRSENDMLRSIIQRAQAQVPSSVWTWHEDANEALK